MSLAERNLRCGRRPEILTTGLCPAARRASARTASGQTTMHNVVVGTGPAAAAAILALADDPAEQITVVDIGERLARRHGRGVGPDECAASQRSGQSPTATWSAAQPVALAGSVLPEKRAYGSNHMFIDLGQQRGLTMPERGNDAAVSGAVGGFSTVWGAQIMPFSRATFDRWPFGWDEIEPHYRAVLAEVPLAGEEDDYAEDFPLLAARAPLPPVSGRTAAVLERYRRHRDAIRAKRRRSRQGSTRVRCRLAVCAAECA